MEKNKKLLLIVLGVLVVIGIGVSFAYFAVNATIGGKGADTRLGTSDFIKVEYDTGDKLESEALVPGHTITKEFKVIITPTDEQKEATYRIYMNIASNTFVKCNDTNFNEITNNCSKDAEEIVYRLKDSTGTVIKTGDLTNSVTGEIELARETKTQDTKTEYLYTLEVEYIETNKDQNHNKNAVITGEVKVEFAEPDLETPAINNVEATVTKTEINVVVTASDDIGVTEYWYQLDSGSVVKGTGNTYKFTGLTAGTKHTVKVYVKDAAGNQSTTFTKEVTTTITAEDTLAKLNITGVKNTTPTFTNAATTDEGVYSASDGMYGGTSYYWRGASTTNHVIFANKCWRIVRINGDGSIRLIYNGAVSGGTCTGNGSNAGSIAVTSQTYNTNYNRSEYVGWTYSTGSQRTTGGTASNIKSQTDTWYNNNIGNNDTYKDKVADGKFCNDRNVASGYTWSSQPSSTFYYAGYDRSGAKSASSVTPTLSCGNAGDVYTLKAGAITMDEVVMAGAKYGTANSSYYLYNGQYYWTMSPYIWNGSYASVFFVYDAGQLNANNVSWTGAGVRPVINLKADTTFATGGNGTQNNPYVVS